MGTAIAIYKTFYVSFQGKSVAILSMGQLLLWVYGDQPFDKIQNLRISFMIKV